MAGWPTSRARRRFAQVKGATAVIGAGALLASAAVAACADGSTARTSLAAAAAPAALGSGPADALQQQYEDVIKAVLPSVVQISTSQAQGSGVVYDDEGDIVTNAHVVGSASTVQVTPDVGGATLTAKVVGVYPPDDLAVIRVTSGGGSLRPATFGQSAGAVAGQIVLALGSPLGLTGSATQGIISATGRTLIETNPTDSGAVKTLTIAGHAANERGDQQRQQRRRAGHPLRSGDRPADGGGPQRRVRRFDRHWLRHPVRHRDPHRRTADLRRPGVQPRPDHARPVGLKRGRDRPGTEPGRRSRRCRPAARPPRPGCAPGT